jgi:flagellar P-ring protein precursor FlgI
LLVLLIAVATSLAVRTPAAPGIRIKDLTDVEGVRSNPVFGYGLVVGLLGTGDGTQAKFTIQSLANMLRNQGVNVPQETIRVRNAAAVMVTADLPPFARPGQRIDVLVSSIGDAKSLQGGTLLMTPLQGSDGQYYAVAQGAVSIGGAFLGGSGGGSVQKNHPTAGRITGGAVVEREVAVDLASFASLRLLLHQPDFATAERVAGSINGDFGEQLAWAEDAGAVRLAFPTTLAGDPVALISRVEALVVRPDTAARVVINERTGTIVLGNDVRISTVALSHGNLTIDVRVDREVSQPGPFSDRGRTVVVENESVSTVEEPDTVMTLEEGISVGELVNALNDMGATSRDMIAILQAMKAAGALHAEIVLL